MQLLLSKYGCFLKIFSLTICGLHYATDIKGIKVLLQYIKSLGLSLWDEGSYNPGLGLKFSHLFLLIPD